MKVNKQLLLSIKILEVEIELIQLKEQLSSAGDKVLDRDIDLQEVKSNDESGNDFASKILIFRRLGEGSLKEFLVIRGSKRKLAIRIDNSTNHKMPHIHIDIDGKEHAVSISIKNGKVLAPDNAEDSYNKILKPIRKWIKENNGVLMEIWEEVQSGNKPDNLKASVKKIDT